MTRVSKGVFGVSAIFFLMAPLFAILPLAFTSGTFLNYPINGFSLRWFSELAFSANWRLAIANTLLIGVASTLLATVLGTVAAFGLRNMNSPIYGMLRTIFLLPMVAPVVVLGVGMQIIFSRLGLGNSYTGIIIAHAVISIPFVLVAVSASLAAVDQRLEKAAASLGASPGVVFRRVTLPLCMPGVQAGAVFAFATSLDEVILVLFLGGANQRTVAREMFAQLRDNVTPVIAAVAFAFIIGTICLAALTIVLGQRRKAYGASPLGETKP